MKCAACEAEMRPGDRFCGLCGAPIVRLIEGGSSGEAKVDMRSRGRKTDAESSEKTRARPDMAEKGAALGAALADEILPGSETAKNIGMTLGRRIAERIAKAPLISFGTDPASAALAAARTKASKKAEKKAPKRRKPRKKTEP